MAAALSGATGASGQGLVFSEIMYNSGPPDGDKYDFIELYNAGTNQLDLAGTSFFGITYRFTNSTVLAPGARLVVVKSRADFDARYPGVTNVAPGNYGANLANGGEKVALTNDAGLVLFSVTYDDVAPWPTWADGLGCSLQLVDPAGDPGDPANWRSSVRYWGSPGTADAAPQADIVVNEVLTHTDPPLEDAIELHNPTAASVSILGWYLTDDPAIPNKYCIGQSSIPAGGYAVFYEYQFNNTNAPGGNIPFALSSGAGDQVLLYAVDVNSNLVRIADAVEFGPSVNGVSFGRYPNGIGELTPMTALTFGTTNPPTVAVFRTGAGAANSLPKTGPVVISEIMYHPVSDPEYIELLNITSNPVPLYDPLNPTNTWKLATAVDFTFPTGVVLAAGERLLVSGTNSAALRAAYGIAPGVQVFGGWTGALNNAGETVELYRPDNPNPDVVPYYLADRVSYDDKAPWPAAADGDGPALEKVMVKAYGNTAANWMAGPVGGTPGFATAGGFLNPLLQPAVPAPGQSFTVTVAVVAETVPTQVVVRVSAGGTVTDWIMRDNGTGGDAAAGDGIYTAVIGGQPDGTWLHYAFQAFGGGPSPVENWSYVLIGALPEEVRINEIMYHPDRTNEAAYEYIELYNPGTNALNLSGWQVNGIDFTLPSGAWIGAQGCLAVAASQSVITAAYNITNVVGNWGGQLKNGGETLTLLNPFGRVIDRVTYSDRMPWPGAADGYGPSLERIDKSAAGGTNAAGWAASRVTSGWFQVSWTGQIASANTGLKLFLDFDGKCRVDDVSVRAAGGGPELVANGGFEAGLAGWSNLVNHAGSRVETGLGYAGTNALVVVCNFSRFLSDTAPYEIFRYGDAQSNWVGTAALPTTNGQDYVVSLRICPEGPGKNLFVVAGALTNRIAVGAAGTPGRPNGAALVAVPPVVSDVRADATMISTGVVNVVRARVAPAGIAAAVVARYRTVATNGYEFSDGRYTDVAMADNGVAPDTVAGDGEFAATLPAVTQNWTLVRYHVQVTGTNGVVACGPRADDPAVDLGYWVEGRTVQTTIPNWHVLVDNGGDPLLPIYPVSARVCAVSPEGQVFIDATVRHRGRDSTDVDALSRAGLALRVARNTPLDTWFAPGQGGINFRHRGMNQGYYYRRVVNEPVAYDLQRLVGLAAPRYRHICLWINGVPTITTELEDPEDAFLDGNGIPATDYVSRAGYTGRNQMGGDGTLDNFVSVTTALSGAAGKPALEAVVRSNLWYESIQASMALLAVTANGDQNFEWNMFQHRRASDGRWAQYPWDVDLSFDDATNSYNLVALHPYYQTPEFPSIWKPGDTNGAYLLGKVLFHPRSGAGSEWTLGYRYRQQMTLWRWSQTVYTTNFLSPAFTVLSGRLVPAYRQLTNYYGNGANVLTQEVAAAKQFIANRRSFLVNSNWVDKMAGVWNPANVYDPGAVTITEMMVGTSPAGEYVELYNRGSNTVDLGYWQLSVNWNTWRLPLGTMIGPTSYLVIADSPSALTNVFPRLADPARMVERYPGYGVWDFPIAPTSAVEYASRLVRLKDLAMSDTGALVDLYDLRGQLIDRYGVGGGWPTNTAQAFELIDPSADNAVASNWYNSPVGGTPGFRNGAQTLEIISTHGTADPSAGIHTNAYGLALTNSVSSPDTQVATQYICTGWAMTGNAPAGGATNVMAMNLTNNAVLMWQWSTNYWLATDISGTGSVNVASGWTNAGAAVEITATAGSGSMFSRWIGDTNGCMFSSNRITVVMNQSRRITANFMPPPVPGTLQFATNASSVSEAGGSVVLTVTRTGGSAGAASVSFATANGTALAGSDYMVTNGTLSWADGDSAGKTITVAVINDSTPESNESFTVTLSGAAGAALGAPAQAIVTVVDDDIPLIFIVDNNDGPSNVTVQGAWSTSMYAPGYWSGNYLHDGNADKGTKSVTFRPTLPTGGVYAVSIWHTTQANYATDVPVDIVSAEGTRTVVVNEQINGSQWYPIGTNQFKAGTNGCVRVRTTGTTGYVVADAVKFTWVGASGGGGAAAKTGGRTVAGQESSAIPDVPGPVPVWASGAWSDQFGATNLLDGNPDTVWIGNPGGSPWRVMVDLGRTEQLNAPDVMFFNQPWTNMGLIGSCDASVWFDFRAVTNWPVATRYIYLNLWDPSGTSAPPAIRELLWLDE